MLHKKTSKTLVPLLLTLMFSAPLVVPAESVVITVNGGVTHSIHGVTTIKETLFGENWGSGGTGGADKINATWFRSTSACNITQNAIESKSRPGFPNSEWLAEKYPSDGVNTKKNSINMVRLFHVKAHKDAAVWPPRPFSGRVGSKSQSQSWAEICAAYVVHAMRPYANGTRPSTMWEFGNEVMWQHYLHTPAYDMDPNRQGPGCNGENAATAYRQWVHDASKAIKKAVPDANIMAGSGDMITYSSDWWGWKYWDKPFLDLCISNIDAYATHWYSTVPEQMVIEAALIHNYTAARYNKPIPTHVTEYNIPNFGALAPNKHQWCRTRYEGTMLFAALRDPDKIAGLYRFVYSDPRFMPKFQVKGSNLETWLTLTRDLRGTRLLTQSSSDNINAVSIQGESSIVTLICNDESKLKKVTLKLKAPKNTAITSYTLAGLAYDTDTDTFQQSENLTTLDASKDAITVTTQLAAGATLVLTTKLSSSAAIDRTVRTEEFIPKNVLIPTGKTIEIAVPDNAPKTYAMLRFGLEIRSSRWSDLWVELNGHLYQLPTDFWRRPCQQISIPILPEHIKQNNKLIVHSAGQQDVTVITAAIELSDVPMSNLKPSPYQNAIFFTVPNYDLTAGKTYTINFQTISGAPLTIMPADIRFNLPENWTAEPLKNDNTFGFKLSVPQNAVIDWYPIEMEFTQKGQTYTCRSQLRVNTPVQCTAFKTSPVIDADISEWIQHSKDEIIAPCEDFETLVWSPGHRNHQKTGNTMSTGWTKEGFWFVATITTDKPVKAWLDFFFDMNADRTLGRYDRNDHQFKITLAENGLATLKQIIWNDSAPRIEIDPQPNSKVCWQQKDDKITVEGFIPADAFHIFAPVEGDVIGFDFRINNKIQWYSRAYEQAQNQFPSTKSWGHEQVMRNPASWGWLRFN